MSTTTERFPIVLRNRRFLKSFKGRDREFDFLNYHTIDTIKFEDDFLGGALNGAWTTGGAGTAAALVSGANGGAANLVTGAVDNQCSTLYLANLNFTASSNPVIAAHVYVDSIATGNVQIGFTDSTAAGVLGATGVGPIVSPLTDAPTLTGSTADCVVATYDLSSALSNPTYWRLAGSAASTPWLVTPSNATAALAAPAATTYQWIHLAIQATQAGTPAVRARLYVDGVLMAEKTTGAVASTATLTPFLLIGATSAASRTLRVDYASVWADRNVTGGIG